MNIKFKPDFFTLADPVQMRFAKLNNGIYLFIITILSVAAVFLSSIVGTSTMISIYGFGIVEQLLDGVALSSGQQTVLLISSFLPIFFIVWLCLRLFENRGLASIGMQIPQFLGHYLRGVVVGLLMFGSVALPMWALGLAELEAPFSSSVIGGSLLLLVGWIVQGAGEEVLVRGYLMQIYGRITNPLIAIIISSLFFAFLHIANNGIVPLALINLSLFGIFAALYTIAEGGLWGIFAIHSVWNWAQGNLFGFEVSGNDVGENTIINLVETGPDLWTGGLFGPEGGLIVTIVLLIGCVVYWRRARMRPTITADATTPA